MVVVFGRQAGGRVGWQDDYAVVARADTYLVLGADHAIAVDTAQFGFFDGEAGVAVVELCPDSGHHDFLAGGDVGRSADNLLRLTAPEIYGAHMHVV